AGGRARRGDPGAGGPDVAAGTGAGAAADHPAGDVVSRPGGGGPSVTSPASVTAPPDTPDVFADLVGQEEAVATLRRAAAAAAELVAGTTDPARTAGMTHAWLFTGPPGSGRSVAARAFAAALQCHSGAGCGHCAGCRTTLAGTHADVQQVVPEGLSIPV